MTYNYITEIADVLDAFFKGLTDCQILTTYRLQLQISEVDIQTMMRIRVLIQDFIKTLQILEYKMSLVQQSRIVVENVATTIPAYDYSSLKESQEFTSVCDPIICTTTTNKPQFAAEISCANLSDKLQDCFKISHPNEESEKNCKINKIEVIAEKYDEMSNSLHSTDIKNLKCIIPSDNEWKKNEQHCFIKNSLSDCCVKNDGLKTQGNKFKNGDCKVVFKNNFHNKQFIMQDVSLPSLPTNTDAENIVHIIVETTDKPSTLVINGNHLSKTKDNRENNYMCLECNKIIKGETEIENHLSLHKLICHICQQEFISLKELKEHGHLSHENSGNFSCSVCSKVFATLQEVKKHNFESHSNNQNPLNCRICDKTFITKLGLMRHIDSHGGKNSAVCDICGKSFRRSDYLRTHCTIHLGKKKFGCNVCPKRFVLKTQLKLHEKVHSGIKDFVCDICNKGFNRKDKLKEHVLRHLNIKKFQCDLCNKHYAENRDLRKHFKSHKQTK